MTPLTPEERQSDRVKRKHRLPTEPTQEKFTEREMTMLRERPRSYGPDLAQSVVEDMGEGYSFGGFAGRVGIGRSTINLWREKHPEFDEACSRAMAVRQRWWETLAIHVAKTGGIGSQATMVITGLMNAGREDWQQKQVVEHSGQVTLAALVESSMKAIAERSNAAEELPAGNSDTIDAQAIDITDETPTSFFD